MKYFLLFGAIWLSTVMEAQVKLTLEPFYSSANQPIAMAAYNADLYFVAERPGRIIVIKNTGEYVGLYLDISDRVSTQGEGGLLGLAFHPNYAENSTLYLNYTEVVKGQLKTIIAQVKTSDSALRADVNSFEEIYSIDQPYSNHNGGDIHFGPDNYLYIATGDGGDGGDPGNRAQNLLSSLGKMLRFETHPMNTEEPFVSIPADNPYADVDNALSEIWATGLRNPWRFSFDKEGGDLWIADVGQNKYEEIHRVPLDSAGVNYGWNCREGFVFFKNCETSNFTDPVYVYPQPNRPDCNDGNYCGQSITGGYVYRGSQYPSLVGQYVFADFVSNNIWTLNTENYEVHFQGKRPHPNSGNLVGFFEDFNGELFAISLGGTIFQVQADEISSNEYSSHGQSFEIYPNPAQSEIRVSLDSYDYLSFYNVTGQLVKQVTSNELSSNKVEVYDLVPGLYYVIGHQDRMQWQSRFVKQ